MKLIGFTTTYNVSGLIPYVMPYVERLNYDKFIVYDNMSTDNTVDMLKQYPFVEVRTYDTSGVFSEDAKRDIQLNAYLECYYMTNNGTDNEDPIWMTFTDFDEVIFYNEPYGCLFKNSLLELSKNGYNYFSGKMINLIPPKNSDKILLTNNNLAHSIEGVRGNFWNGGCKPTLIYVNDITYYNPSHGNHKCMVKTKEGKDLKKINNLIVPFHLKWVDKKFVKDKANEYVERGNYMYFESIDYIYDNVLYPLSFPLETYFYDNFKKYEETIQKI